MLKSTALYTKGVELPTTSASKVNLLCSYIDGWTGLVMLQDAIDGELIKNLLLLASFGGQLKTWATTTMAGLDH